MAIILQLPEDEQVVIGDISFIVPPYENTSYKNVWPNGSKTITLHYGQVDANIFFHNNIYMGMVITDYKSKQSTSNIKDNEIVTTRKSNGALVGEITTNAANNEELFKTELEWVAEH
jgi:hypothetical protein